MFFIRQNLPKIKKKQRAKKRAKNEIQLQNKLHENKERPR